MNKEKEPTGIWTWPDTYSDLKLIEVTAIDVKYIRSLLVGWDIAELGAPGLMTRDGDWLYDVFEEESEKESLLSLFMNLAKLPTKIIPIKNAFCNDIEKDIVEEALYGLKDKATKKLLLEEENISLEIDNTLKQLWDDCWLTATGFDPKRGFRLSNLQALIDPEKQLTKSKLAKEKQHYKGQLFLYLQLFIQQATIETGFYHSYDAHNWKKGKDYQIAEKRTAHEWFIHFNSDYFSAISDYRQLTSNLPNLTKHLCASKSMGYQDIAKVFNFDKIFQYDSDNINRLDIDLIEILLKSLDYFPEEKQLHTDGYALILLAVRIYNAQGEFLKAQQLLQEANLDLFTSEQLAFFCSKPDKYKQVAFYESCISKMGISGDYSLFWFPEYPKFTDEEIKKYNLDVGFMLKDSPEHKIELEKIERLMLNRTMIIDMRDYLDYEYRSNIDLIYDDLDNKKLRGDLDDILVSVIGQLFNV